MDQTLITRIVEAALLAAHQPLTLAQLHALFPEDQPAPNGSVEQAIEALQAGCAERGIELVELASGFRYQVKNDVHPWVARLWTERQTRYTRATLETLALIAYRQPITRGEIEQVRGVAVNSNIIRALEEREWIRVVGHRDVPGKPALFGTTKTFLDYFGLKRLDELPPLSELKEIGELEPELMFEGGSKDKPPTAEGGAIAAGGIASDTDDRVDGETGEAANDPADTDVADIEEINGDSVDSAGTELDGDQQTTDNPPDEGEPEAAPGERVADENEQDNAGMKSESISSDDLSATPETDEEIDSDPVFTESEAASNEDAPEQRND
ncbi:SMC-Scp complex subunit ScpB [Marilutibacter alkalisoli]|uniref:SMC-Scp complex subunit ScpB n=1 Tax=Marilutibacter alkalisoli TaxID=2591633 RepID=A0A514BR76_9GAMM|nr:SMC-Scp complex subunit ScpB [Lysobacter alkalisoli]QDH69902.1 SMC-Scp complex subunit ScpB [Lysobacter alkalisoli]